MMISFAVYLLEYSLLLAIVTNIKKKTYWIRYQIILDDVNGGEVVNMAVNRGVVLFNHLQ